jgi:hypothetical protein
LKNITGNEDLQTPILLIPFYTILFASGANKILDDLKNFGSVVLSEPIFLGENIFGTMGKLSWFIVPTMILILALKQKHFFLKATYFLGTIPLLLTKPIIKAIGIKSLYFVKYISIFIVILCLIIYLNKTIRIYQAVLQNGFKADNKRIDD